MTVPITPTICSTVAQPCNPTPPCGDPSGALLITTTPTILLGGLQIVDFAAAYDFGSTTADASTDEITIGSTDLYLVGLGITLTSPVPANFIIEVLRNGSLLPPFTFSRMADGVNPVVVEFAAFVPLVQDDVLQLRVTAFVEGFQIDSAALSASTQCSS